MYHWADSDNSSSSSSDSENGDGGGFAAAGGARSPDQPSPESGPDQPSRRDSPSKDPSVQDNQEHLDEDDVPNMSDDCPDSCDYVECEGLVGSMSSHLAKLDSLSARGCADKFFKVHTARWGKSMARPGDYLHSARAGGADVRETRKRKADAITRMAAESHAFCTSSNLSQKRSDAVLETFTNVSTIVFKLYVQFCLHFLCCDDIVAALASW